MVPRAASPPTGQTPRSRRTRPRAAPLRSRRRCGAPARCSPTARARSRRAPAPRAAPAPGAQRPA
eukprot:3097015-Prymnesium_polylepis.1